MIRLWAIVCVFLLSGCGGTVSNGPNLSVILAEKPAKTLSEYGLMKADENGFVADSQVHSYDLINPLFTDYAAKQRYVFVPKGKQAKQTADAIFLFLLVRYWLKTLAMHPICEHRTRGLIWWKRVC